MTAAWVEKYQRASFRGVEFFIDSSTNELGRRNALHEFPGSDISYSTDLGLKTRTFGFSAYIIGDDYFDHRDTLIRALEAPGAGELVHPYRGTFQAVVTSARMTETTDEGRMARFQISFREQGNQELTSNVVNTFEDIRQKKEAAYDASKNSFLDFFKKNNPITIVNGMIETIDNISLLVQDAKKTVSAVAEFKQRLQTLRGKVIGLVLDGDALYAELQGIIDFGTDVRDSAFTITPENARTQITEYREILGVPKLDPDPNNNVASIENLNYQLSITAMASLLGSVNYESKSDSEDLTNQVYEFLDQLLLDPGTTDEVYTAFEDLKTAVQQDAERRSDNLGELFDYEVNNSSIPSLVVANELYGSIDREQEIIDRNKIQYPAFIEDTIRVLINVD